MPPTELLEKLSPEDVVKVVQELKKFDKRWNIGKVLTGLFVGVSFIFGSGVGFQKGKEWVNSVDTRLGNLEIFTGYNKIHEKRMQYINSIKIKDGSGSDNP